MNKVKSLEIYNKMPVLNAVIKNAVPAILAMLMVLVYNLADTFFIAQTNNVYQVTAVSLATPIFLMFMSVGSVFGVGGTSVISRAFGEGRPEYAKKVSSFCMWGSVVVGIIMCGSFLIFMDEILILIGASDETYEYTKTYLTTISLSGTFAIISTCFSNLLRADGQPEKAMKGQIIGNALNMCLDAILIVGLNLDILGCGLATLLGETASALYYIFILVKGNTSLSIKIKDFSYKGGILKGVLLIGIPTALGSLLMSFSGIIVNMKMADYSDMAVAGIGVAMKIVMITGMISLGIGQGIQPLLGYCVGSSNWSRFKSYIRYSIGFSTVIGVLLTALCYIYTNQIISIFLVDEVAIGYALTFSRIMLSTSFIFGVFYVITNALQAMGASMPSLIINISRQGLIYIPTLIVLNNLLGINGLVWAQPIVDIASLLLAGIMYIVILKKMMNIKNIM